MKIILRILFFSVFTFSAACLHGQSILLTKVTVEAKNMKISDFLKTLEQQGNFYFSYNNRIVNEDSLITISARNKTVKTLLENIFGDNYQYIESNNHLIIQPNISTNNWYVSGYVIDLNTGEPVSYATVFEQQQLAATMTDENGFFRLPLKEKRPQSSLSVSKLSYKDTVIIMSSVKPTEIRIPIQQKAYELDSVVISGVEKNWLASAFISSKQAMNSLNLNHFFTEQPFQFSLTPGLGTHGSMSSQVINKFSLNLIGGYTAGVDGFEFGTLFNIVKADVRYVQIGGLFNVVGGNIKGVQIAGLYNTGLKSMQGFQAATVANIILKDAKGVQVSGLYNITTNMTGFQASGIGSVNTGNSEGVFVSGSFNVAKNMTGFQAAGSLNVNVGNTKGVQIAGVTNFTMHDVNGVQISSLLNYAKKLKGVQIAFINVADSTDGYSIGILNIMKHGYHKLSISSNEWQHISLTYKSGNAKLYSMLIGGMQLDSKHKAYSYGYGIGSDRRIGHKGFFINPELSHQYIYNGNIDNQNLLSRFQIHLKYRIGKYAEVYAGPAFSILYSKQVGATEGYQSDLTNGYPSFSMGKNITGWLGWSLGVDLF